jgi:hypothetical protein
MTTFKPWEYRAEAGFVKGTDLTGYTVVAVDGDLGHVVEAEYDGPLPAHLYVDVGWLFGHHVMLPVGLVERIDARRGRCTSTVRRTRSSTRPGPNRWLPTTSTIGSAWVVTTPTRSPNSDD